MHFPLKTRHALKTNFPQIRNIGQISYIQYDGILIQGNNFQDSSWLVTPHNQETPRHFANLNRFPCSDTTVEQEQNTDFTCGANLSFFLL